MSSSPRATSAAILARKDSRVAQVSEFWDLDGIFDEAWSRKGLELRMGVEGKSCGCCYSKRIILAFMLDCRKSD